MNKRCFISLIVAMVAGAGFGVDTNKVTILSKDGENSLGLLSKEETAEKILEFCVKKES